MIQRANDTRLGAKLRAYVGFVVPQAHLVIIVALAVTIVAGLYAGRQLGIDTDTANMISARLPWRQDFIAFRQAFPDLADNLVAVIDGPTPEARAAAQVSLAAALAGDPAFLSVRAPGSEAFFERNGLLFLDTNALAARVDRLAEVQPLLSRLHRDPGTAELTRLLGEALDRGEVARVAPVMDGLARALKAETAEGDYRVSWRTLMRPGGQPEPPKPIVLLRPERGERAFGYAARAIRLVRDAAQPLAVDGIRIRLTGPVAMEYEELVSVASGALLAGLLALTLVAIVLYVALRSFRLLFASVLTLVCGLAVTAGFAALAVGKLNLISIAFAVLYIGLGIDFAIHYCLRYRELVTTGLARSAALTTAASDVGSSLVLCAVTTSVGFYAFIPTNFSGVAQLGLIAGTGMYVSLIATLTLLPALIAVLPGFETRPVGRSGTLARAGLALARRRNGVLRVTAVLAVAALAALPHVRFDSNPVNLRDASTESVATFRELAGELNQPAMTLNVIGNNDVEATRSRLESLDSVRELRSLDSFVPADQAEKLLLVEDLALILGPELDSEPGPVSPLSEVELDDLRGRLDGHAADNGVAELAAALDSFRGRIADAAPTARVELLRSLDGRVTGTLPANLSRLRSALGAHPVTRDDLPSSLKGAWLAADGRQRLEIWPAEDLGDHEALGRFVDEVRAVVPAATGLPVVHVEAGDAVVRAFGQAFLFALIVVGILMFVLLRRVMDALRVMVPLLLAMLWTTAIASVLGIPFNFANVIALPLLLGVGVDNGIHLAHRREVAPPADGNLLGTSTARAVVFSALTTIASFGNLALSGHPGTASMGMLLTIGMLVMVLATLVVLPAFLSPARPTVVSSS